MRLLKERIIKDGIVKDGDVLKVDSFLNHQIDVNLYREIGKEFYRIYAGCGVNKIVTIEASGIGIAVAAAMYFDVPVVFAKKSKTRNIAGDVYKSVVHSFTHGKDFDVVISKDFLNSEDKILIIDDFLANGSALEGLCDILKQSGAEVIGAGIVIEKGYQAGGKMLREQGMRVESLAIIDKMGPDVGIIFRE
ncbi:MAG: xanthine phosphoribosyltransferase [Clostridia bacterium]|nr:xanthine phosphoribosyltransferase [Clostridia bacterium]